MVLMLQVIAVIFSVVSVVLVLVLLTRKSNADYSALEKSLERTERIIKEEIAQNRTELSDSVRSFRDSLIANMGEIANLQKNQLEAFSGQLSSLTQMNEQKLDKVRETVEERLRLLQEDNSKKLEQMRHTVDEKLHATLEQRLGESFKLVSDRLELVHQGLGEMQSLATGVGDLKKVLTNIKTRGTWGEIQLGNLLEQILAPDQYSKNVATKEGSNDRVEYAIKLPGPDSSRSSQVWLPVDAKFPVEDYQRLVDAQDKADPILADEAAKQLEASIRKESKTIRDKYIDPPNTTDFAVMFLPVEGLYAEVLRRPGLAESIQNEYRVTVAGPTNFAALLTSLQMGFRTLAIEKRSSEVWALLGAVKTEFVKFGDILDKTHKKLQEASNTINDASRKSRTIERKLRDVQELPSSETDQFLEAAEESNDD